MGITMTALQVFGFMLSGGCIGFAFTYHYIRKQVVDAEMRAHKWQTKYYLLRAKARIVTGEEFD